MGPALSECSPSQDFERTIPELCIVSYATLSHQTGHQCKQVVLKYSSREDIEVRRADAVEFFISNLQPANEVASRKCRGFLLNCHEAAFCSRDETHRYYLESYNFDCFKLLHDLRAKPGKFVQVAKQVLRCFKRVVEFAQQQNYKYRLHFNLSSFKAICLNDGYIIKYDWTDPEAIFGCTSTGNWDQYISQEIKMLVSKGISRAARAAPDIQISGEKESFEKERQPEPIRVKPSPSSKDVSSSEIQTSGLQPEDLESFKEFNNKMAGFKEKDLVVGLKDLAPLIGEEKAFTLENIYAKVTLQQVIAASQQSGTGNFDQR